MLRMAVLMLLLVAALTGAQGSWLAAKAAIAQHLLSVAWIQAAAENQTIKPWPWADTWPVARLSIPEHATSLIVLEGVSGEAMAFGPGRIAGSSTSADGVIAIGGHRDTHLSILEQTQTGTVFEVELLNGQYQRYRQSSARIVDTRTDSLSINPQRNGLVLITCYPIRADQTGGPLRYVVTAVADY